MNRRIIIFRIQHLSNPAIYRAMVEDNVQNWKKASDQLNESIAVIDDHNAEDFPHLRATLQGLSASYSFESSRNNDNKPYRAVRCANGVARQSETISQETFEWLNNEDW